MTQERILTFVGAGGVRSPLFLQAAFRRGFRGEIRFFDKARDRQDLMQRIGMQMLEREGMSPGEIRVSGSGSLSESLEGTDAVVIAIRPGGLALRARDEETAFSMGLLGQETVGVCGMAMACRTLPALMEIAHEAKRVGANPWIFNFTNPVGITSLGLWMAGFPNVVGICDSANQALYAACQFLHLAPDGVRPETFGLNHLSWTRALWHDGRNVLTELLTDPVFLQRYQDLFLDPERREQGLFFNEYLYYYYRPLHAVRQMAASQPLRGTWLAEQETRLVNALRARFDETSPHKAVDLFLQYHAQRSETYMAYAREGKRGAAGGEDAGAEGYAGVALDILEARYAATDRVRVLVLPNKESFAGLPGGVAVEVSCRLSGGRVEPVLEETVPEDCARLIRTVGGCERLVAESILEGSEAKLRQALAQHPLVGPEKADACIAAFGWGR